MYVWTAKRNSPRWRKSFEGRVARSSIFLFLVRAWGDILLETESWIFTRMWFERRIGLRDLLIEKLIDSTKTMVKPSISFERKRKWNKFSTVKKRKRKNSPLALKNFLQSMPNVDMYTPKKKKKKESHCPTNYSFFSAFNLRNNRRRGYFAPLERGRGGEKKNRMIFKGHVDKESLGLHFLRNFQVCLFSYSVPCCAVEKNFESMFYKNMQRKGLEGKEEKFNVCKITSRNFLLYQRYRDSPTKLRSIEFKISPVKWFLSRNLHLARGHLWILKGIEPLNRLVPGY